MPNIQDTIDVLDLLKKTFNKIFKVSCLIARAKKSFKLSKFIGRALNIYIL